MGKRVDRGRLLRNSLVEECFALGRGEANGITSARTVSISTTRHQITKTWTDSRSQMAIFCPRSPATSLTRSLYSPKAEFKVESVSYISDERWNEDRRTRSHECRLDSDDPDESLCITKHTG